MRRLIIPLLALAAGACVSVPAAAPSPTAPLPAESAAARPVPYPVLPPPTFERAVARHTRTTTGEPGPAYWLQWADYAIEARVDVDAKTLNGSETIRYHNNSPGPLPVLVLNVTQNVHEAGVERNRPAEVTGGMTIERVAVDGQELGTTESQGQAGWAVQGTVMYIVPPRPVQPGDTVDLALDFNFELPQSGVGGRMGYSRDNLLYLGYWYPQMAVYDDIIGWHADAFRGTAEFYADFASYDITVDAPSGWIVMGTGRLDNADEVLQGDVVERLRQAESSDTVVHVVTHDGASSATMDAPDGRLSWHFVADSVHDAAFAVMKDFAWDAERTAVGDRDGDGATDFARVDAFWRKDAKTWAEAAGFARQSIAFHSDFTGLPYAWSHMSAVEGGGIIGGGMEFPMMTLIGAYEGRPDTALYGVIAHELGHEWVPMMVSTNERRYAWMDEGTTSFLEDNAYASFYPGSNPFLQEQQTYAQVARARVEGPIMRWSDFHYPGPAYGVASYAKPATLLHALTGVLGEDTFMDAFRAFFDRWAFKHPYPWDLFNTFEDVSGRDLDWFWRSWYYESSWDGKWWLDQAVSGVERLPDGETRVTISDLGWVPMPTPLTITRGTETSERTIPVDAWLTGKDRVSITLPAGDPVTRVEIDAQHYFPDIDRSNNVWTGG